MSKFHRIFAAVIAASLLFVLAACGDDDDESTAAADSGDTSSEEVPTIRVAGATSNPLEQESIEFVRDEIAADYGIEIEYVHIEDSRALLEAVETKDVDANVMGHAVYLNSQNESLGFHLAPVSPLFLQRQVLYSKKYSSVDEIEDGAEVAISNHPVGISTALKFLEQVGLVKIADNVPLAIIGTKDIVENPKNLKFVEVDSVARAIDDLPLGTHGAYQFFVADIDPKYEIAAIKGLEEYSLQLAVHQDNVDRDDIKKLIEAFEDERLDEFVEENYSHLVTPIP